MTFASDNWLDATSSVGLSADAWIVWVELVVEPADVEDALPVFDGDWSQPLNTMQAKRKTMVRCIHSPHHV
jgi:hypothetical protein